MRKLPCFSILEPALLSNIHIHIHSYPNTHISMKAYIYTNTHPYTYRHIHTPTYQNTYAYTALTQ